MTDETKSIGEDVKTVEHEAERDTRGVFHRTVDRAIAELERVGHFTGEELAHIEATIKKHF